MKLGCVSSYNEERGAVAPADVATCRFDGEQVTLVVGDDEAQRDATIAMAGRMARAFGVKAQARVVVGGSWAVMTESVEAADDAHAKVGGTVR